MINPDDDVRDKLLRFLYARHKTARGIGKIPIGILELKKEMKQRHQLKPPQVVSNLDYLIQVDWVKEVVRDRTFTTERGMKIPQQQITYKISHIGINHLEANTMFTRPESFKNINITNVQGVTVVGEGNVVNAQFTDLARALDELDRAIGLSKKLDDTQKLDAVGDLSTIRTQIAKKHPNKEIIKVAWESLKAVATIAELGHVAHQVGDLIVGFLGA